MSFGTRSLPPLGAPPGRSSVRSPKGLVTPLTVLFGLRAATRLLTLAAQVNRYSVLGTAAEGGAADTAAWQAYTMALGPALPAMAVTAAVFISNRLADGSTTVAGVRDAALASAASDLLFVVAAALAVVLVRRISAMQEA